MKQRVPANKIQEFKRNLRAKLLLLNEQLLSSRGTTDLPASIRKSRIDVHLALNNGCDNGCSFCLHSTEKPSKDPMPFEIVEAAAEVFQEFRDHLIVYPYYKGDPLSYGYHDKTIKDIIQLFSKLGIKLFISTAVPPGKEGLFFEVFHDDVDNLRMRLSLSFMNERRLIVHPEFGDFSALMKLQERVIPVVVFFIPNNVLIDDVEFRDRLRELRVDYPQQVFPSHVVPNFSNSGGALFLAMAPGSTPDSKVVVNNIITLSSRLFDGRIEDGKPFLLSHWTHENKKGRSIQMRSWKILPIGRTSHPLSPAYLEDALVEFRPGKLWINSGGAILERDYDRQALIHGPNGVENIAGGAKDVQLHPALV